MMSLCALRLGRSTLWLVAAMAAMSCADVPEQTAEVRDLWPDEAVWHRIGDLWASGIAPGVAHRFEGFAGSELRMLVIPLGEAATVRLRSDEIILAESVLSAPEAVHWHIEEKGTYQLELEEGLLVRPRMVSGRLEPRRRSLVVIDTLRADSLTEELAPEIFRALPEALAFSRAFAPAPWTLPTMAGLFTGESTTALRQPGTGGLISLADDADTVAEGLREDGWITVGVCGNPTANKDNGFAQGFDLYWVPAVRGAFTPLDASDVIASAEAALEWFDEDELFLYLHFMEPHDPYRNHQTGVSSPAPSSGSDISRSEVAVLREAYASEVSHLSQAVAPLLEELRDSEALVVTSDHGEEFLEHGGLRHGLTVFPEVTRVPLLVAGEIGERALARGVELEIPRSLTAVRALLEEDLEGFLKPGPVTMESFGRAARRWGTIEGDRQWVLFPTRWPAAPGDAAGQWLLDNHPAIHCETLEDGGRCGEAEPPVRVLARMADQYRGFEKGVWLFGEATGESIAVTGNAGSVLCWSGCRDEGSVRSGSQGWEIPTLDGQPLLVFVSAERPEGISVRTAGREVPAATELELGAEWPVVVQVWRDQGRPTRRLDGIEETLRRLRSLGYIES